jgi:hypothetical protein
MHNAKRAVLLFATVVLVACAGQVKTNTSYDETVNFASYKTFAQPPPPSSAANMPGYSEIVGRQIQDRISMDLQQKGLEPAALDEADLQVSGRKRSTSRAGAGTVRASSRPRTT